jgi:hypothetical protein
VKPQSRDAAVIARLGGAKRTPAQSLLTAGCPQSYSHLAGVTHGESERPRVT